VDKDNAVDYSSDMSGKYCQAFRSKNLRDSGLFEDQPLLEDALLVAVIHSVYIIFKRETGTYWFFKLREGKYQLLYTYKVDKHLELADLVAIVESLEGVQERYGRIKTE
jgi:hypothetical protein